MVCADRGSTGGGFDVASEHWVSGTSGPRISAASGGRPGLRWCRRRFPLPQRPVPAAQRLRTESKAGPPLGWKQQAGRGEEGSVDGRVPRPLPSTLKDRELVAQGDDLKLPLTATAGEHANEAAQKPVQQTPQHDAQSEPAWPRSSTRPSWPESNFFTPHAVASDDRLEHPTPPVTPPADLRAGVRSTFGPVSLAYGPELKVVFRTGTPDACGM